MAEILDRLLAVQRVVKRRVILSTDDVPEIRRAFKGLTMWPVRADYSVAWSPVAVQARELIITGPRA